MAYVCAIRQTAQSTDCQNKQFYFVTEWRTSSNTRVDRREEAGAPFCAHVTTMVIICRITPTRNGCRPQSHYTVLLPCWPLQSASWLLSLPLQQDWVCVGECVCVCVLECCFRYICKSNLVCQCPTTVIFYVLAVRRAATLQRPVPRGLAIIIARP